MIGRFVFGRFFGVSSLAGDKVVGVPKPHILGHGLKGTQDACDAQKAYSASATVVAF